MARWHLDFVARSELLVVVDDALSDGLCTRVEGQVHFVNARAGVYHAQIMSNDSRGHLGGDSGSRLDGLEEPELLGGRIGVDLPLCCPKPSQWTRTQILGRC